MKPWLSRPVMIVVLSFVSLGAMAQTTKPAQPSQPAPPAQTAQKLGDAVLAQQADVMDAVQRLRSQAHANKKLETTKQQTVAVRQEQNDD